jgi:hypothetical protein
MSIESVDVRIGRVERIRDLPAIAAALVVMVLAPAARLPLSASALLVAAGLTLLGSGLVRHLGWLATHGRPATVRMSSPTRDATLPGVHPRRRGGCR